MTDPLATYRELAELRRFFSRFNAELQEFNIATTQQNRHAMDDSRGLIHAFLDQYLDHMAKVNENVKQN